MRWNRSDSMAVIGLALLPFLFLWPLFVPGGGRQYFEGGDFVDQFYAFASYEARSLAAGRLPLWNPFAYAGSPFWADIQSAVAYPPSLLVALIGAAFFGYLPFLALELEAVAHLALAGVFTYLFARRALGSRPGALMAAVTFALGGYLTGYPLLQLAVLVTVVWLPLALLGVLYTVEQEPLKLHVKLGRGLVLPLPHPLLPLAIGMAVLAGHPQSTLYVLYAIVAYLAWRSWPWRQSGRRPWQGAATALVLGLGLSAAGWLPALQFLRLSNRATADYAALSHGFPPRELLGIVLTGVTKWSPLYVGVLPLLVALVAGWRALVDRDAGAMRDRFWVFLGLVALFLSLGGNAFLFDIFYLFAPGFDLFRGQERAAFLVSFSLAMLAGRGITAWLAEGRPIGRPVATGAVALAGLGFLLTVLAEPDLRPLALRLLFLAGGTSLLAAAHVSRRLPVRGWYVAMLAFVALDLYLVNGRADLVSGAPGEIQVTPLMGMLRDGAPQRVYNDRLDLIPPNFGVLHGVEATSGASPLRLRTFETLWDALRDDNDVRLSDLLAVSHVLTWRGELGVPAERLMTAGEGDGSVHLFRLETAAPYVWRVSVAEAAADDGAAAERLRAEDFDPLSAVVLHDGEPGSAAGYSGGVGLLGRWVGETLVSTAGDAPAWLVFSEVFYPGWRATVDGSPADVLRADVALMAVPVAAGEHEVRLYFTSTPVDVGLAVSVISALVLLALWRAGYSGSMRSGPSLAGELTRVLTG